MCGAGPGRDRGQRITASRGVGQQGFYVLGRAGLTTYTLAKRRTYGFLQRSAGIRGVLGHAPGSPQVPDADGTIPGVERSTLDRILALNGRTEFGGAAA